MFWVNFNSFGQPPALIKIAQTIDPPNLLRKVKVYFF